MMPARTPPVPGDPSLPLPRSSLVGRSEEIAEIRRLLIDANVPLLTLVGTGGVGKTRLALHAGHAVAGAFADGVCLVRLEAIREPGQVTSMLGQALGVHEVALQPLLETIIAHLRSKQMLLLLDNFEHVVSAASELGLVLERCLAVQVLATSRVPLRLDGEHILTVPPLTTPGAACLHTPADLRRFEAVDLFVQRAQAADRGFTVNDENAGAVTSLCAALDGLPLAIELAASRVKMLSPRQMLDLGLDQIGRLEGAGGAAGDRHRTMRSAIEWSYQLLTPPAQRAFRWLSVFSGGVPLPIATAVLTVDTRSLSGDGDQTRPVLDLLASLVDHSLLSRFDGGNGDVRFAMLEPVREYAIWQLGEHGESAAARAAHAASYAAIAALSPLPYFSGLGRGTEASLSEDYDNVRVALAWLLEEARDPTGARLAAAMCGYWNMHCLPGEARRWIERAVSLDSPADQSLKPFLLGWLAVFVGQTGDHTTALQLGRRLLALAQSDGDVADTARALLAMACVLGPAGGFEECARLAREGLRLAQQIGDVNQALIAQSLIAAAAMSLEDYETAGRVYGSAIATARRFGASELLGECLDGLGTVFRLTGRVGEARALFEEGLQTTTTVGDDFGRAVTLSNLAHVEAQEFNRHQAARLYGDALKIFRRFGGAYWVADTLVGLAVFAVQSTECASAVLLFGAEFTMRERARYGFPRFVTDGQRRAETTARQSLGTKEYARLWQIGTRLSLEQTIDLAIALSERLSGQSAESPVRNGIVYAQIEGRLSDREEEVLRLLTRRLSDKEIAEELLVSVRTVHAHVRSVFSKLDVSSRREAAAAATRLGLV